MSASGSRVNRRDVLKVAGAAATVATGSCLEVIAKGAKTADGFAIIDTNVSLFHWPFRRLPLDDGARLVAKLRGLGVAEAWAGSFEGLLHRDITGVNHRLAFECAKFPELRAIGSINPELPDWREDFRRCRNEHGMLGIRLHPNYHDYTLADPGFIDLLEAASAGGLLVQIAVAMEDTRTQSARLRAADVDLRPLVDALRRVPEARVQLLNLRSLSGLSAGLAEMTNLFVDTARLDGSDAVPRHVHALPEGRVLFGSHAPLLIPEAALIRVHESDGLTEAELRAVYGGNARLLIGRER